MGRGEGVAIILTPKKKGKAEVGDEGKSNFLHRRDTRNSEISLGLKGVYLLLGAYN